MISKQTKKLMSRGPLGKVLDFFAETSCSYHGTLPKLGPAAAKENSQDHSMTASGPEYSQRPPVRHLSAS